MRQKNIDPKNKKAPIPLRRYEVREVNYIFISVLPENVKFAAYRAISITM